MGSTMLEKLSSTSDSVERDALIEELFAACDADGNGHLNQEELAEVAFHGWDVLDEDWHEVYSLLCSVHKIDPSLGMNLKHFRELLSNQCEDGYTTYCTNDDLRRLITLSCQGAEMQTSSSSCFKPAHARRTSLELPP